MVSVLVKRVRVIETKRGRNDLRKRKSGPGTGNERFDTKTQRSIAFVPVLPGRTWVSLTLKFYPCLSMQGISGKLSKIFRAEGCGKHDGISLVYAFSDFRKLTRSGRCIIRPEGC